MACTVEYLRLTETWIHERGQNTIVLYQNGSFFEIYGLLDKRTGVISGSQIEAVTQLCDLKIAEKKNQEIDGKATLQAGFKTDGIEKYVKKLYNAGYTVPIYEQQESETGTGFVRVLTQVISPGTFWSNDQDILSNNTTCVWIEHSKAFRNKPDKITIGMSTLDILTGKSCLFEFSNVFKHDPATYDELERFISINNPSEMIIIHNMRDEIIDDIIKFANIQCKSILKINKQDSEAALFKSAEKCEKQTYQSEIIKTYFPTQPEEVFFETYCNYPIATQSFCFLLDFVQRHNPGLVNKITSPTFENCSDRLILANHSLNQLNIIGDDRYSGKLASVSSFLNNCVTNMGKRQFTHELLNPIKLPNRLRNLYDITEHLIESETWDFYRRQLQMIKDIEKLIRKLIIKKITPKDITSIYHIVNNVSSLLTTIQRDPELVNFLEQPNISSDCSNIHELIETTFDVHKAEHISDISFDGLYSYGVEQLSFIKKGISSNVDLKIKTYFDSREKFECIRAYLSGLIQPFEKKLDTQFIKIHETAKSEDCLMGTKRRVTIMKTEIAKIKTGKVVLEYTSPYSGLVETFELNTTALEYKSSGSNDTNLIVTSGEIEEIAKFIKSAKYDIVTELMGFYSGFIESFIDRKDQLHNICNFITKLDTLQNRCYIAHTYNYCKPVIEEREPRKSFMEFEGIRHCLIEHIQNRELYVTNDMTIGADVTGYLLFGTNAVGKTSFIRSVGVSLIMAQAGLYVPCSKFIYYPYSYIFTRIIGNDNLFKGQSTFAVEMSELRTILNMANSESLVLGDELCSGTEQGSATSIFGTGLEFLDRLNASYIFATHFHEITSWPEITGIQRLRMMHMSVIYDKAREMLIYDRKLKAGPGENMYGLEVCKSLSLPEDFLERAHQIRLKYYPENSNITNFDESHFNKKKIKGICELCKKNVGEEVHHLQHQKSVNGRNNYIDGFHKNHPANLFTVCEDCHDKFHDSDAEYKRVKTTDGYDIVIC